MEQVQRLLGQGRLIEAIKRYRELTGVGLKEAKEAVEALRDGRPVAGPGGVSAPRLPQNCPICGAPVNAAELRWVGPDAAECAYCGYHLRTQ